MPEVVIDGIPVLFPFSPYDVQVAYMQKVISCLEKGGNGVLESPTGTGKTLSLLCASCAWLIRKKAQMQANVHANVAALGLGDTLGSLKVEHDALQSVNSLATEKNLLFRPPKIIYASRTHSQLTQAVQELKRTSYKHVKVSVLGSRDQMCIHPEVSREETNAMKTVACRIKVKSKTCHFHNNVDRKKDEVYAVPDILDIEDLVKLGKKMSCCPYYLSRELNMAADITFMPYNYLLEIKTRRNLNMDLNNCVIILDEAHNIEKVCEESGSLSLSSLDVAMCLEEVSQVMKEFAERLERGFNVVDDDPSAADFSAEDLCLLKTLFLELENVVDTLVPGSTFPGDFMFELLQKCKLVPGTRTLIVNTLMKVVTYLSTTSASPFQRKGASLQKFVDLLNLVYKYEQDCPTYTQQLKTSYKVHVSCDEGNSKKASSWSTSKAPKGKIINFWCFCPQFGIDHLVNEGIHSLILTSGTLAPLETFVSELGLSVCETLENPHIVEDKQVCVAVLKKGPDGCELNSSFNSRNNPNYLSSLGRTIANLSYIIPDGLLVFFPSYFFMKCCQDSWQQSGVWSQIERNKPIFLEPRNKNDLNEIMNGYYGKIKDPATRGACFMAVTRGKVSEGLDFADFNGRAVVVTGLPFPPFKDPRVELKKQFLDETLHIRKKSINGRQWYTLEATKAVNQAIGRVIRHASDYGAILLCDSRFDNPSITSQLSSWIRPRIKKFSAFGPLVRTLREFYRCAEKELPAAQGKPRVPAGTAGTACVPGQVTPGHKRSLPHSPPLHLSPSPCDVEGYRGTEGQAPAPPREASVDGVLSGLGEDVSSVIDFNDSPSCSSSDFFPDSTPQNTQQQPKKRKLKIVPLKFLTLDSPEESETKKTEESSGLNTFVLNYVIKVKQEMGSKIYTDIKNAISSYKKSHNLTELFTVLKSIFCSSSSFHLLRDFEPFVRRDDRKEFRKLMDNLISSSS